MAAIQPSECSVFIQIWVDTNALQNGLTNGVYLVDNNLAHGSTNEGTTDLNTNLPTNAKICWTILNTNVNWNGQLSIQNFGNAGVFGAGGTPQQINAQTWTGQVQENGADNYAIYINAVPPGGTGITTSLNPKLTVSS